MPTYPDRAVLERLHILIAEALALSDAQHLHAIGIALDTARIGVEDALAAARGCAIVGAANSVRSGAGRPPRG